MIAKPEDTEMPTNNPHSGQEIPKFEGGGLASQQVTSLNEFRKDVGKRSLNPNVDERPVAPAKSSQLTSDMLRDCVLPEYDGSSDEFVLGGKVTAKEALQLYRDFYAKQAEEKGLVNAQEVDEVSPAEIIGGSGKRIIWLPVLWSRGQMLQMLKGEKAKLTHEVNQLEADNSGLRSIINRQNAMLADSDKLIMELKSMKDRLLDKINEGVKPWWKRLLNRFWV